MSLNTVIIKWRISHLFYYQIDLCNFYQTNDSCRGRKRISDIIRVLEILHSKLWKKSYILKQNQNSLIVLFSSLHCNKCQFNHEETIYLRSSALQIRAGSSQLGARDHWGLSGVYQYLRHLVICGRSWLFLSLLRFCLFVSLAHCFQWHPMIWKLGIFSSLNMNFPSHIVPVTDFKLLRTQWHWEPNLKVFNDTSETYTQFIILM